MKFGVYKVKYLFADNTYLAPDSKTVDDFIRDCGLEKAFEEIGDIHKIGEIEIDQSLLEELSNLPIKNNPETLRIFLPSELSPSSDRPAS